MKIFVKVKANAKQARMERLDESHFAAWVKAPPIEGRANKAVIELAAGYFQVPKSHVEIISGQKSKQKTLEIRQ